MTTSRKKRTRDDEEDDLRRSDGGSTNNSMDDHAHDEEENAEEAIRQEDLVFFNTHDFHTRHFIRGGLIDIERVIDEKTQEKTWVIGTIANIAYEDASHKSAKRVRVHTPQMGSIWVDVTTSDGLNMLATPGVHTRSSSSSQQKNAFPLSSLTSQSSAAQEKSLSSSSSNALSTKDVGGGGGKNTDRSIEKKVETKKGPF